MKFLRNSSIFSRLLLLTAVLGIFPIVVLAFLLVLPLNLSIDELRHLLGILLMAIPVAALCLAALATRTIRSSLQKLLMAQRRFYSGDFDIRIPVEGDKDSINLYRGFNVMAELVKESTKRAIKEERTKALALQASHVAHDMRSPLSVLKSYVDANLDPNDPSTAEYKAAARRSVSKLLHMADDLVDYAKASKVERARQDISRVVTGSVISETNKDAEEVGATIRCEIEEGIFAHIDGYKIERVLINLVKNAIQATKDSGDEIILSAVTGPHNQLIIKVQDSGKGIDPDSIPHVFDSFFTKGKKSGTGLGLAYCKQVVEAHGGTIEVESQISKGTTFTIAIPNCVEKAQGGNMPKWTNVLIADDDVQMRELWQRLISETGGHIVRSVGSVEEIENDQTIDYRNVDTAIVDYHFEGGEKTGIDLAEHLKQKGVKRVFLCTGYYDDSHVKAAAKKAGIDRIIPKPLDDKILRGIV